MSLSVSTGQSNELCQTGTNVREIGTVRNRWTGCRETKLEEIGRPFPLPSRSPIWSGIRTTLPRDAPATPGASTYLGVAGPALDRRRSGLDSARWSSIHADRGRHLFDLYHVDYSDSSNVTEFVSFPNIFISSLRGARIGPHLGSSALDWYHARCPAILADANLCPIQHHGDDDELPPYSAGDPPGHAGRQQSQTKRRSVRRTGSRATAGAGRPA